MDIEDKNSGLRPPENKMGTMPINKLLINMSLPPMVSMLAAALYNVVESIFVAKISEDALTALTLVFPVQMFMIAINGGIGVGLASLISRRLGQKRQSEANAAATHGFVFAGAMWVLYTLFAIFFAEPFLRFFTGTGGSETIFNMALVYCRFVMIGSLFINTSIVIERILQSTGNTFHPMLFNIIGVGMNTILAPILIMGYFGIPSLGVAGAGLTAIIGQCTACMVAIYLLFSRKHAVHVSFRGFRFNFEIARDILAVGAPSMVMQAVMPILVSSLNKMLFNYESAVFVLGVYFRISTFVILPVIGLNQGALPVMGYSFGAKNRLRLLATYKTGFVVAAIIMAIGAVIFFIIPDRIMMLFSASGDTLDIGTHALRAIAISWIPASFSIMTIAMFQALAHAVFALIISIVRQIGFILPLAYLLLVNFGVDYTWYAFPLAEIVALLMTSLYLVHIYRKEIKPLPDGAPVLGKLPEPV